MGIEIVVGRSQHNSNINFEERLAKWVRFLDKSDFHPTNTVFRFAKRIIVMVGGRILVEGTPQEIAADKGVREAYLGGAHHV